MCTDKEFADLNAALLDYHDKESIRELARTLNYEIIDIIGDPSKPGFLAVAFKKISENTIVLIHRGTDPSWCNPFRGLMQLSECPKVIGSDFYDDLLISFKELPEQLPKSEQLLESVKSRYKDSEIVLSGYSLGGVYAELVGIKYGLKVVSFDSPGVRDQAIQYAGNEKFEQNKYKVTAYKSSPNMVNTVGQHYTDLTMTEFLTPYTGPSILSYWGYTFAQHDIRLISKNLGASNLVKEWPSGILPGYIRYLSSKENNLHWYEHIKKIWEDKRPDIVFFTPDEAVFEEKKASFEKYYKARFLDREVSHEDFRQEELLLHDKLKVMYEYKRHSTDPLEYAIYKGSVKEQTAFYEFTQTTTGIKIKELEENEEYLKIPLCKDPRISKILFSQCKLENMLHPTLNKLGYAISMKEYAKAEEIILNKEATQENLINALNLTTVNSRVAEMYRIAEMLLRCGIPVDFVQDKDNPIFGCASFGSYAMMNLLFLNGANPQATDSQNFTILHHAVLGGIKKNIKASLASGVDYTATCKMGWTALVFAQKLFGYESTAEFLEYSIDHIGDILLHRE